MLVGIYINIIFMLLELCPMSVYRHDAIWHSSSYSMLNMENINILRPTSCNHHTHHIAIKRIKHIKYVIHQNIYTTHISMHHNSYIIITQTTSYTHTSLYTTIRHHIIQLIYHHNSYIIIAHIISSLSYRKGTYLISLGGCHQCIINESSILSFVSK